MKNGFFKRISSSKMKLTALIVSAALICTAVAATVAFIIDTTDPIENVMTPSKVACQVTETFENDVKTNVAVKNTGDTEAYIRAAIVVTWMSEDKTKVTAAKPQEGTDYTMIFADNSDWLKGTDGYYYYKKAVAPSASTGILIASCTPVGNNAPAGFYLSVEIVASAIQSVPETTVETEWNVTITDGVMMPAIEIAS